jgi:hypothetical protein
MAVPPYNMPRRQGSSRTTIAGILLILSALFGVIMAISFVYISSIYDEGGIFDPDGIIEGKVEFVGNETDVENINVTLKSPDGEEKGLTDSEGEFRFSRLTTGKHTIIVNKTGYKTVYEEVFFSGPGETKSVTIELEEGNGETRNEVSETVSVWNQNLFLTCGVLVIVFSFIAFMGGIFAIKRTNYWLALLGSVAGIFALGIGLGFIFSLIALFLLLTSRNEFKQDE